MDSEVTKASLKSQEWFSLQSNTQLLFIDRRNAALINIKLLFPWHKNMLLANKIGFQLRHFSKVESWLHHWQKTHCFHLLMVWHALLKQWGSSLHNWAVCSANNKPHWLPLTFCPLLTLTAVSVYVCEKLLSHQIRCTDISLFVSITVSLSSSVSAGSLLWALRMQGKQQGGNLRDKYRPMCHLLDKRQINQSL